MCAALDNGLNQKRASRRFKLARKVRNAMRSPRIFPDAGQYCDRLSFALE
jgi:hypothetical protein